MKFTLLKGKWIKVRIDQIQTSTVRIERSVVTEGAYVSLIGDSGQHEYWHLTEDMTHALIFALQSTLGDES